jgi:hypothetical protein
MEKRGMEKRGMEKRGMRETRLQKILRQTTASAGLLMLPAGPMLRHMKVALNFPTSRAGAGQR